jgi:hypothetical protein
MPFVAPQIAIPRLRPAASVPPPAAVPASTGEAMTLDALMARQKDIAARQAGVMKMPVATPEQGMAQMAWTLVDALQQRKAERQEAEGRSAIANIFGQVGDTGPSQEQIGRIMAIDPDLGAKMYGEAMAARRAEAEYQRSRADKLADVQAGYGHEEEVNKRELAESQATTAAQREYDEQKRKEEEAAKIAEEQRTAEREKGKPQTEVAKLKADLDAGRIDQPTYEAEVKKLTTPSSGVTIQNIPAELGAKIALGDEFLSNYESIQTAAKAGKMTGPIDYVRSVEFGRGEGGLAYRQLKQGSEALVRMLTGAGKSQGEAEDEARNYLPTLTDDADTLSSKIEGLKNAMTRIRAGVTAGRNAPPAPTTLTKPADIQQEVWDAMTDEEKAAVQ